MKILDCSFRDGGYYTNWSFDKSLVNSLIDALSESVDIIELGYKSLHKERGLWGRCDDNEVNQELNSIPNNLCFMIDLKDFKDNVEDLSKIVRPSYNSPFSYCRIAIKYDELPYLASVYNYISDKGYKVFVNLMQAFSLSRNQVEEFIYVTNSLKLQGIYFADSYGSLTPNKLFDWKDVAYSSVHNVGFHGHDNFGLAFSNSLAFSSCNFTYIDATVTGIGRGCGNTKLEQLLLYNNKTLSDKQVQLVGLFEKLKRLYGYGFSINHMIASIQEVHPIKAQNISMSNLTTDKQFNCIKNKYVEFKEKVSVVIPARYESTRFPAKPLAKILGKEMILWVCEKAEEAVGKENVYVASDHERIFEVVTKAGYKIISTPSDLVTGTDRVAYAANLINSDIILNIQGDEPLIEPNDILRVIEEKRKNPDKVINCFCKISEDEDPEDTKLPKVVISEDGNLVYMSRGANPFSKNGSKALYKQVCIYAFNKEDLKIYDNVKTPVEKIEDIEILRCLEKGKRVKMVETFSKVIAVDYKEDIELVERTLLNA